MNYCFGVDIGGTTVKIGLFQTDGELVDKWEIKTRTENGGEAILPDVAEALKKKMEEKGLPRCRESESGFRLLWMKMGLCRKRRIWDGDTRK